MSETTASTQSEYLKDLKKEIDRLKAENGRMREALSKCIELCVCQTESEMFIDEDDK
jgi:hypothetical protein